MEFTNNPNHSNKAKAQVLLLEHPRPDDPERAEDVVNTPLSACLMTGYIASLLESNGIAVDIIDANLFGWSTRETIIHLRDRSYKLIGIHLVYLWEKTQAVFDMLLELHRQGTGAHLNLYGHYPTFAYTDILNSYPFIDSITVGEPEYTFLELAKKTAIHPANNAGLSDIKGLASKTGNTQESNCNARFASGGCCKIHDPEPRALINELDSLPFPDRRFHALSSKKGITTYILASRGCYNNCSFCYLNPFYGNGSYWRGRSPQGIFEEIDLLYRQDGITDFYFADANFFGPGKSGKARAKGLAELLIAHGLKIAFGIECRASDIDVEVISILIKAGLRSIFMGIEGGNQLSLNVLRKNVSLEVNKDAINIVRKLGLRLNIGFIMFRRDSTLAEIRQNFEFLQEMDLLTEPYTTAHLLHHRQVILQGTPDYCNNTSSRQCDIHIHKDPVVPSAISNYEMPFESSDRRISALVELTTNLCRKAMSTINSKMAGCRKEASSGNNYPNALNRLLIRLFGQTLSAIEKDEHDPGDEDVRLLKAAQEREIQTVIDQFNMRIHPDEVHPITI